MMPDGCDRATILTDAQRDELFELVERRADESGAPSTETIAFLSNDVLVCVEHPGGGKGRLRMQGRKISPWGTDLIHSGYLHPGTECRVELPTVWGHSVPVNAKIDQCSHLMGLLHSVSVVFEDAIDLRRHLEDSSDLTAYLADKMPQSTLGGRIMLIDDQEVECRLLKHHLAEAGVDVSFFMRAEAAIQQIQQLMPDLVLCDLCLGDGETGEGAISALRDAHYTGPVVLMTGETAAGRLSSARDAGASTVLSKPYSKEQLLGVVAQWLPGGEEGGAERITSSLVDDPGMQELIKEYLQHLDRSVVKLRESIAAANIEQVRGVIQDLKDTGAGYGFGPITEAAGEAVRMIDSTMSIGESMKQLHLLTVTCQRASPT